MASALRWPWSCLGSAFSVLAAAFPDIPTPLSPFLSGVPYPPRLMKYLLPSHDGIPAHSCPDGRLSVFVHRDPSPAPGWFLHPFAALMLWTALPELSASDTSRLFPAFPSAH